MEMKFDKKQLKRQKQLLIGKGISEDVANDYAELIQAVEYAVYITENFDNSEEAANISEIAFNAYCLLEDILGELYFFEKEEASATV